MKKRMACLLAIITAVLAGCGSNAEETAEPIENNSASGSVVTLARDLDSNNLDPVMTADNCNIWVINMMIEGLVTSSDDGKRIVPAVADTWSISDDGLTYQFHIRDGIYQKSLLLGRRLS